MSNIMETLSRIVADHPEAADAQTFAEDTALHAILAEIHDEGVSIEILRFLELAVSLQPPRVAAPMGAYVEAQVAARIWVNRDAEFSPEFEEWWQAQAPAAAQAAGPGPGEYLQ